MSQIAPAPTRDEVLAVYEKEDRVFSAGDVAVRIYWMRGGVGNPADIKSWQRDEAAVLPVGVGRVKKLLIEMVEDGTLMSRDGYLANQMGSVWGNVRQNGTYFALRASAEKSLAERDANRQDADRARRLAELLNGLPAVQRRVTRIDPGADRVIVTLSVKQACEMFGVPAHGWY